MIDAHLHIHHLGRTVEQTLAHLEGLGVDQAVLLPIEDPDGGVDFPTDLALEASRLYPGRFLPFCQVDVRREDALKRVEAYARAGCWGYGEQKQRIPLDDPRLDRILAFCNEVGWPVTFHFEEGPQGFNQGFPYLEKILKRYPRLKVIGHAQSFWAHISAEVPPPEVTLYPSGPVVPGGLTDRWLSDYPNLYADLSAGSGYNALARDEEFAIGFLHRHRYKLLWATDCPCTDGKGGGWPQGYCFGQRTLALLRKLVPDQKILEDILHQNAERILLNVPAS